MSSEYLLLTVHHCSLRVLCRQFVSVSVSSERQQRQVPQSNKAGSPWADAETRALNDNDGAIS